MEGTKAGKSGTKKTKHAPEESSGEDGGLQIDVEVKKTGGKKSAGNARPKKKAGATARPSAEEWGVGDLVWAKVSGFVHWPAKVFDPSNELIPDYLREPPKPNYSLVRFLGTYDIQWASTRQIEAYEAGLKKRLHTKSRSKLFAKALAEVKVFKEKGELPKDMNEKPPLPDSQEESEGEEEEEEEEEREEEEEKAPAKVGTKRKAPAGKGAGKGGRKVKVLDTEETSDQAGEETRDKENGEKKT